MNQISCSIVDDSLISCHERDIINLSSSAHETCFQQRTKLSQFARGSFVLEGDSQNVTRAVKTAYDEEGSQIPRYQEALVESRQETLSLVMKLPYQVWL